MKKIDDDIVTGDLTAKDIAHLRDKRKDAIKKHKTVYKHD